MNWLTNFIRPKIRSFVSDQKEIPDALWQKCPACDGMLFHRELTENLGVCHHCGHHLRISVAERLSILFGESPFQDISVPPAPADPLRFRDKKKYSDRLSEARTKTGRDDAIRVALGRIGDQNAVVAAFDFDFMGGSMGAGVGEGIVKAAETAVRERAALICIPSSGGARMQEGILSLMQMPRSIVAVSMVKEAGLPYLVLLTDPTTGGVSASFAMVGDIHIAEPGATIGFAGKRVIEETIREQLPPGFQTAEYLLAHGMVDMVVPRASQNETIGRILNLLMERQSGKNGTTGRPNGRKSPPRDNGGKVAVGPLARAAGNVARLPALRGKSPLPLPAAANQAAATRRRRSGKD